MRRLMAFASAVILIAGSLYFVYEKLEIEHVRQTNDALSLAFHGTAVADEGLTPAETEAPLEADDSGLDSSMAGSGSSNEEAQAFSFADALALPEVSDELLSTQSTDLEIQPEFQELYELNSDVVGWIQMADCVDYPVLWRDNSYYMDHDFYGESSASGSIFLDARNNSDMSDSVLLIYGHNMRSGEMFGDLDRYREADYLREYPIVTLQSAWESEPRTYVLISLFDASMDRDDSSYIRIVRTSFESAAEKEDFIAELRERSMYQIPVEANADDQLLLLVTCSYSHSNGRFILVARELRDDETESGIVEQFQQMP